MRKLIFFMHSSLDGFVAGLHGEMNWIKVDDGIFDFVGTMTDQADAALYGRVTYQMMEAYWPTAAEKPNASKHDIEHSEWYKKVQKVVLSRTIGNTILMANDVPEVLGRTNENENRSKIVITAASKEEADKLFNGLSEGGQIEMPIDESPWGTYFGMFRDKYGIEWMVDFDARTNK